MKQTWNKGRHGQRRLTTLLNTQKITRGVLTKTVESMFCSHRLQNTDQGKDLVMTVDRHLETATWCLVAVRKANKTWGSVNRGTEHRSQQITACPGTKGCCDHTWSTACCFGYPVTGTWQNLGTKEANENMSLRAGLYNWEHHFDTGKPTVKKSCLEKSI